MKKSLLFAGILLIFSACNQVNFEIDDLEKALEPIEQQEHCDFDCKAGKIDGRSFMELVPAGNLPDGYFCGKILQMTFRQLEKQRTPFDKYTAQISARSEMYSLSHEKMELIEKYQAIAVKAMNLMNTGQLDQFMACISPDMPERNDSLLRANAREVQKLAPYIFNGYFLLDNGADMRYPYVKFALESTDHRSHFYCIMKLDETTEGIYGLGEENK